MTRISSLLVAAAFATFGTHASAAVTPSLDRAEGPEASWCAGPRATSNHAPRQAEAVPPPQATGMTATAGTLPDADATAKAGGCQSLTQR